MRLAKLTIRTKASQCIALGLFCMLLGSLGCSHLEKTAPTGPAQKVRHEIQLTHPSLNQGAPVNRVMTEYQDASAEPKEYSLDVRSVICGDEQCEVIIVRLHLDPLGRYTHCSFPRGGELTRRGHEAFTAKDYQKLKQVLSDKDSSLENIDPNDVVKPTEGQNSADEDVQVDGVTTATLLSDKSEYVEGAIYTSYTLYHWVNREIVGIIRSLASRTMSDKKLTRLLDSEDVDEVAFALAELTRRGKSSRAIQDAIKQLATLEGTALTDHILSYYESAGADQYYPSVEALFEHGNSKQRILYIASLTATELEAPSEFYDNLSAYLPTLKSYQEIHMFISLLRYRNPDSATVVENALPLLNNPSFKIARKGYKFLAQQDLTPEQAQLVETFKKKNHYRL